MSEFTEDELYEAFNYLDELRDSGETNMFGAPIYVGRDFGYDKNRARSITSLWMGSFDGESSVSDRVSRVLETNK